MKRKLAWFFGPMALLLAVAAVGVGQRGWGRRRGYQDDGDPRRGVPTWEVGADFKDDVFTFARIRYSSGGRGWGGWGGRGGWRWRTDYPDSDLNFSFRLHELTSLEVDPDGKIVELTDDELFDYPFIYLLEPGDMDLDEGEVQGLRRYLLNGGFLMVDDFWGQDEWFNFYQQIKRVFPDREPEELPLDHDIFQCVYKLNKKPQIPSIHAWLSGYTTERWDAPDADYRAIFDDQGRMMVIICHNTDLGDGWEREGEDPGYFKEMSEKWAYPLGINILTYAMTH